MLGSLLHVKGIFVPILRWIHKIFQQILFQEFVRSHLKERICSSFVWDKKSEPVQWCGCGRDANWHGARNILPFLDQSIKWDQNKHSKFLPQNTAYGEIEFGGFGNVKSNVAKVRIWLVPVQGSYSTHITHMSMPLSNTLYEYKCKVDVRID